MITTLPMFSGDEPPCTLAGVFGPSVRVSIRTTNRARGARPASERASAPGSPRSTQVAVGSPDVRSQGGHIDANSAKSGEATRERVLREDRDGQHKPV